MTAARAAIQVRHTATATRDLTPVTAATAIPAPRAQMAEDGEATPAEAVTVAEVAMAVGAEAAISRPTDNRRDAILPKPERA
jgi:hypothetical protein